jgi:hypothetical protein
MLTKVKGSTSNFHGQKTVGALSISPEREIDIKKCLRELPEEGTWGICMGKLPIGTRPIVGILSDK